MAASLHGHDYVAPPCFHSSLERTQTCTWIISCHYSSAVIHHFCSKTTKFHIPELFSKHRSNNKPLNWKHSCIYGSLCFPRQSPKFRQHFEKRGLRGCFQVLKSRFSLPPNLTDWTFQWLRPNSPLPKQRLRRPCCPSLGRSHTRTAAAVVASIQRSDKTALKPTWPGSMPFVSAVCIYTQGQTRTKKMVSTQLSE